MRIYAYGAHPPCEGAEIVEQQFRLGCTYQKVLVLIERSRRAAVDHLYRHACPAEHAALEAATKNAETAAQAVRLARSTGGEILPPDDDVKAERRSELALAKAALAEAQAVEKAARQTFGDAKRAATPRLKRRLKMCDKGAYARKKFAYNAAGSVGLAWGTRLKLDQFAEQAAQASIKIGSLPKIPRFDGGGTVAVQLQGGLDPKDAIACTDTQFRLEKVSLSPWDRAGGKSKPKKDGSVVDLPAPKEGGKRSQRGVYLAHLRVGSEGRAPVWTSCLVSLQRPLPEVPIKWVELHAHRVGPRTEWKLLVTVDDKDPAVKDEGPTLAVNLGWRNLPDKDAIRVAYIIGTDGVENDVLVPATYVRGAAHVASLEAIRKRLFNQAVRVLGDWIEERGVPDEIEQADVSEDVKADMKRWATIVEAARYRDRWMSPKKLVRFLSIWNHCRVDGDEQKWKIFAAWRKKDRHLWFWEADERAKLDKMRKEEYRKLAAEWAEHYARVVVTDMDLRDFAELPPPEEGAASKGKVQRVTQRLAAPSVLCDAIENACSTRGTAFVERYGANTMTCNVCGKKVQFDARKELIHTCFNCKNAWDQDANHCRNLLLKDASDEVARKAAEALAPTEDDGENGTPKKRVGRWQKRRSKKPV